MLQKFDLYAGLLMQSCAVQSGDPTMHYGQSIADGDNANGQIPRLLGMITLLLEVLFQIYALFYWNTVNVWPLICKLLMLICCLILLSSAYLQNECVVLDTFEFCPL